MCKFFHLYLLISREEGLEPSTYDFGDHCSTIELFPFGFTCLARLELTTFGSVVRRSIQMSYKHLKYNLTQLSYYTSFYEITGILLYRRRKKRSSIEIDVNLKLRTSRCTSGCSPSPSSIG